MTQKKRAVYPFDDWFRRLEWPDDRLDLMAGSDFKCSQASFLRQLRAAAQERGIAIRSASFKPSPYRWGVRVSRVFRSESYPWNTWLDGHPHVLVQGVDTLATVPLTSFASQIHTAASRRGQKVTIKRAGNTVRVQALTPFLRRDEKLDAVAEALGTCDPARQFSLRELEDTVAHLPQAPKARALGDALRALGWEYKRTAQARFWVAPG